MTARALVSTLNRDMLDDPTLTPEERAWWQAVADMARALRAGTSEAEMDRLMLACDAAAERCWRR